jgi:hypothetical protein
MIRTIGVTAVATRSTTGIETGRTAAFASAASDPGFGRRDDPHVVGGVSAIGGHILTLGRVACGRRAAITEQRLSKLSTERGSPNGVVDSLDPARLTRCLVGGRVIRSVRWLTYLSGPQGRFGLL